uniref:FXNA-like protease n=1 Tax=Timema cristinae TaxID=61476 RepID=A0A7R9GQW1_TIMCR|nr:unnamed protein product [Timema cristinae]
MRLEEPEQLFSNQHYDDTRPKQDVHRSGLPLYSVGLVFLTGFVLFWAENTVSNSLPTPLKLQDKESHPGRFITEEAWGHLHHLTSFGPKLAGSYENEVLAVDYLTREINFIIQSANPRQRLLLDVQKTTGGSDDGLNCAVMLEVLRVISQSNTPLQHNVIFLFNGAEESPLKASHGFITQHKWAKEIAAFINLEACGAGGKEILFQAGPNHPWLVKLYVESAPHPNALVLAEDIFQSDLIPSDTDFRVFRDFGNIPGLDFAHAMNGYVYHTKYDNMDSIPRGTVQHTGDNLLALVQRLASSAELSDPRQHAAGREVYFNILPKIVVHYSEEAGVFFNLLFIGLSIYTALVNARVIFAGETRKAALWQLTLGCGVVGAGWLHGILTNVMVALILDALNRSMSWYSRPGLIFGLYYCPTLVCMMALLAIYGNYKNVDPESSSSLLKVVLCLTHSKAWQCVDRELFMVTHGQLVVGCVMAHQVIVRFCDDQDTLLQQAVVPLIVLVKDRLKALGIISAIFLLTVAAVTLTPLGFPYGADPSQPTPQRILTFHVKRTFYSAEGSVRLQDSGYFLFPLDRHSPDSVAQLIPEVSNARNVVDDCHTELFCGLPVSSARMVSLLDSSSWIPADAPPIHIATSLELMTQTMLSVKVRRLTFRAKGPENMGLVVSVVPNVELVRWSFEADLPAKGIKWLDRSAYFIHYTSGSTGTAWDFWLDFEVPSNVSRPIIDIALSGHYFTDKRNKSPQFSEFLNKYPEWTHVTAWTVSYKSYKF